ncbi:GKN1 protein, partial [Psophia crepitans]|nr:GKN1 protein [Psophia crepitans]
FQIVTTVLLGLLLTPALAAYLGDQQTDNDITKQITINGGYQTLIIRRQLRVAIIEQRSPSGSWKTIWNYNTGYIASKVLSQGACFVSVMNRNEMPSFDSLLSSVTVGNNLKGQEQYTREITFNVIRRPVRDLQTYGTEIYAMCSGLPTYVAYEVQRPQYTIYNQGSCIRLDVLQLVNLNYCQS